MLRRNLALLLLVLLVVPVVASLLKAKPAFAAAAGNTYMRCDRMKAATAPGNCLVVFTTSSTTFTEAFIKVLRRSN